MNIQSGTLTQKDTDTRPGTALPHPMPPLSRGWHMWIRADPKPHGNSVTPRGAVGTPKRSCSNTWRKPRSTPSLTNLILILIAETNAELKPTLQAETDRAELRGCAGG
jgi:hypothetical protein